ncbi:MAG: hypothetical protein A4E35_01175 [Methanoregula sp. PtaU1.Bin051]|nr:MAG: hypothetical protein A4E35_01175 [Methanoregula sp. PtaU1.Bin051]
MAEKKSKQSVKSIYKILAIIGCVLFVVLMVVSSLGTGWITAFNAIKPGNIVTIDYTIRDKSGNPLVTTDQQLYRQYAGAGYGTFYSKQLQLLANQSSTKSVIPLPVYSAENGWTSSFALFGGEHDAISQGIVGMKLNEQKSIQLPFADSMTQFFSSENLIQQGINVTDVHIGDMIRMGVSDSPTLAKNATESSYSVRIGEVTQKTAQGLTIDFGYPVIEIKVLSVGIG